MKLFLNKVATRHKWNPYEAKPSILRLQIVFLAARRDDGGNYYSATIHELCPQDNEAYVKVLGSDSQYPFPMRKGSILYGEGVPMHLVKQYVEQ